MALGETIFWAFAGLAMTSAFFCITRRSPVASALWLVMTLFSLAALYVVLDAQFIAVLQVLVYAGAIMVLFLFVTMLLNLGRGGPTDMRGWGGRAMALVLGTVLALELWALHTVVPGDHLRIPAGGPGRPAPPPRRVPRLPPPPL